MKHSLLSSDGRAFDLALEKFTLGLSPGDNGELESLASSADLEEFECLLAAIHIGSLTGIASPPAEALSRLKRAGQDHLKASEEERNSSHDGTA
ncbi:MAG: hypothetical protein OSB57_05225 [Planctomycetota bacterium]|nr:hypothetical protein [Planctomycetota bacterium]